MTKKKKKKILESDDGKEEEEEEEDQSTHRGPSHAYKETQDVRRGLIGSTKKPG